MPSLITPRELTKWVPGKVLSASDALGWKDVAMWDRTLQFRGSITSGSSAIVSVRRGWSGASTDGGPGHTARQVTSPY
jgi:hypothetical protein